MGEPALIIPIKDWAVDDRPREKLRDKGRSALSDAELLAIIISSGNADETAVGLSRRILQSVDNNISRLASLEIDDLQEFKGIGEAKAISILAALELGRRRSTDLQKEELVIRSSTDAWQLMRPELEDLPYEEFWVLLLNRRNQLLHKKFISRGGMHSTLVDPKIIFNCALRHRASTIILCHNHPSGLPDPSESDKRLTRRMREGGVLLDISVSDHVIIGKHTFYSFSDQGLL
ncbi:MAG: RadC family protein [Bacteroidia bacterium]